MHHHSPTEALFMHMTNGLDQLQLELPTKARTRHDEMLEQAQRFDAQHPIVWQLFRQFTFDRINRGFKNYSGNSIVERIRWQTDQAETGDNQFKINNNYAPYYARKFMQHYPEHEGFFRTRRQTSQDNPPTAMRELRPQDFD